MAEASYRESLGRVSRIHKDFGPFKGPIFLLYEVQLRSIIEAIFEEILPETSLGGSKTAAFLILLCFSLNNKKVNGRNFSSSTVFSPFRQEIQPDLRPEIHYR